LPAFHQASPGQDRAIRRPWPRNVGTEEAVVIVAFDSAYRKTVGE